MVKVLPMVPSLEGRENFPEAVLVIAEMPLALPSSEGRRKLRTTRTTVWFTVEYCQFQSWWRNPGRDPSLLAQLTDLFNTGFSLHPPWRMKLQGEDTVRFSYWNLCWPQGPSKVKSYGWRLVHRAMLYQGLTKQVAAFVPTPLWLHGSTFYTDRAFPLTIA